MAEMEPVAASHEAGRTAQRERINEAREREERAERTAEGGTARRLEQERDRASPPTGERVSVQSESTVRPVEAPRSTSEARELARETRMKMERNPNQAMDSIRDTAQEPASSRISRAIDAMN